MKRLQLPTCRSPHAFIAVAGVNVVTIFSIIFATSGQPSWAARTSDQSNKLRSSASPNPAHYFVAVSSIDIVNVTEQ